MQVLQQLLTQRIETDMESDDMLAVNADAAAAAYPKHRDRYGASELCISFLV